MYFEGISAIAVEYFKSKILGRHQNVEYFRTSRNYSKNTRKILRKCFQGTRNGIYSNYYKN